MTTEKFHLLGKRKFNCAMGNQPLWAWVDTKTDEFYLQCECCGSTNIRDGYSKLKNFVYADIACGVE